MAQYDLSNEFYGPGSDGDATISADTTLARDMYYDNLTIDSEKKLSTGGYKIFVRQNLTVNGTVQSDGAVGGNAAGRSESVAGDRVHDLTRLPQQSRHGAAWRGEVPPPRPLPLPRHTAYAFTRGGWARAPWINARS